MSKLSFVIAAGVVTGSLAWAGMAYANNASQSVATVVRVIDGDTLEAKVAGRSTTIRLLNVDTPETKDPDQPPECLGQEATEFLSSQLPTGTKIDLKYDQERTDRYGRTLAAVYKSGTLVNAEIARAGLGAAVLFEPNRKYYGEVAAAQRDAQDATVGLYDPEAVCTLPAQVEQAVQTLTAVPAETPTDSAAAGALIDSATGALAAGEAVEASLHAIEVGKDAYRRSVYSALAANYRARLTPATARTTALKESYTEQHARLLAEEHQREEEARLAEEARGVEEARLAEEARRREEARRTAATTGPAPRKPAKPSSTTKPSAPKPAPTKSSKPAPSNPYPGYTGPRCYAPGGKTWKPC